MIRIALDAMGGDEAPAVNVAGAILAYENLRERAEIALVGQTSEIESVIPSGGLPSGISIVEAPDVVTMSDKPLAVRKKPQSSIAVGLDLQKRDQSDAFVSAGNTGAVMAGSTLILGLHEGVERPAIAALLPTEREPMVILDCGANVDCAARELRGFAMLGAVFARDILKRKDPRVGLLNIGEEVEKGSASVREAHQLISATEGINFIGNVEGRDLLHDRCDVVVCDGFAGNVILKLVESAGLWMLGVLRRELDEDTLSSAPMKRVRQAMDYASYGGAPLLGVKGISVICHGSSTEQAIANAIGVAATAVESRMDDHIGARFAAVGESN